MLKSIKNISKLLPGFEAWPALSFAINEWEAISDWTDFRTCGVLGGGGSSAGNSKDGGNGCGVEGDYSILIFI